MVQWVGKLTKSKEQYRVTLPKHLLKKAGLEKTRVVEIWVTEDSIIHIRKFNGKNEKGK